MKILLGCVVLLTGCCLLQNRTSFSAEPEVISTTIEPSPTEEENSTKIIKSIFGFTETDMRIPECIPLDALPEPDFYSINTRVIIEGQPVQILQEDEMIEGMWWARKPNDIRRDLDHAEKIYESVRIKFHITDLSFREMNPNLLDYFIDANSHPHQMTVVYMLPNNFEWDGYSSAPWEVVNRGIIVHYLADEWTVAHEIGHYFGLLHPFDEDLVDDTPEQAAKYCAGEKQPNCRNIMNYCNHEPKYVTPDQIERFTRFLRAKRMNHYMREYTDIMLRGHEFPTPSGTNITFSPIGVEESNRP